MFIRYFFKNNLIEILKIKIYQIDTYSWATLDLSIKQSLKSDGK